MLSRRGRPYLEHEVTAVSVTPARSRPLLDEATLIEALGPWIALAERLSAACVEMAVAAGLPELVPIELPPVVGSVHDQALVGELAPIYFVAELDRSGLLRSIESLAGLYVSGGVRSDLGEVGESLLVLWRRRHERFSATEREAMFRRLFGAPGPDLSAGGANMEFDLLMARLADEIISNDPRTPSTATRAALVTAATQLASNVITFGGGVPRLASKELLSLVRQAVAALSDRTVLAALGRRSAWDLVRFFEEQAGRSTPVTLHVSRARSGVVVLGWLSETLRPLESGRAAAPPPSVVDAAIEWLEATLTLWDEVPP